MSTESEKYIIENLIDFGDLSPMAEAQIKKAFEDGFNSKANIQEVKKEAFNAGRSYKGMPYGYNETVVRNHYQYRDYEAYKNNEPNYK